MGPVAKNDIIAFKERWALVNAAERGSAQFLQPRCRASKT
jgi:hypothetical protein